MKALLLAAGLGTRLRPFTLHHPKALVEVGGRPMLENVLRRLRGEGFDEVTVNVHHFSEQIIDWLAANRESVGNVAVSDERELLLDTGGAILHAREMLERTGTPFLIHNVDILSDAPLSGLMKAHLESGNDVTLLASQRVSSRKLIFGPDGRLKAWHHLGEDRYKPAGYVPAEGDVELAFSGIQVMSPTVFGEMERQGRSGAFPVMDFLLEAASYKGDDRLNIGLYEVPELNLIDIGKPETLSEARRLLS